MEGARKKTSDENILVDSLRLSDAEWYACVSEMDRNASRSNVDKERRTFERLPYRNSPYLYLAIHNPDGRHQHFKVRANNLSQSGIGFLHGSYIYSGTYVELLMQHRDLGSTKIGALVRTCTHVKNTIHRVGAEFEKQINLDDFLLAEAG